MKTIDCQGIPVTVRRSLRARCLRLSIGRKGHAFLTVPIFCPTSVAKAFVRQNRAWIEAHRPEPPILFRNGQTIQILGEEVILRQDPCRAGTVREGQELIVGGDPGCLNRRVTDYIKRQTQAYIEEHARATADRIGRSIHRIALKDTVSRWGSCSARGNLNFCWRLGMAPRYVLDYIIAHEVAHLAEMNHGERFWRIVADLCDRRSDAEIWLRRYGRTLR